MLNGAALLDQVRAWLADYIVTMRPEDLDLLTVWAAHTHLVEATYTTPRLLLDSPVPGSGKTTCLEHLQRLCWSPVQMASVSSAALLTRMLVEGPRTLLIDEADRALRPDKEGTADLLAIINSGYKRGATRPVLVPVKGGGWQPQQMPTFAPVAMAGNDPKLPDDTRSRVLRVLLLPDLNGTAEESDWELIEPHARQLGELLAQWAAQVRDQVASNRPTLPEGVRGRMRECWAPLKRIAVAAGGDWPERIDRMAHHHKEQLEMDREDGLVREKPAVALLKHIAQVWPKGEQFVATADLVPLLIAHAPQVWGSDSAYGRDLTPQRMGRMLAQGYGINSRKAASGDKRGYTLGSLAPAMVRMTIEPPHVTVQSGETVRTVRADTSDGSDAKDGLRGEVCPRWQDCSNGNCETFQACVKA